MQTINRGFMVFLALFATGAGAQNAVLTKTFQVSGNCDRCRAAIEKAADMKGVRSAHWSETDKILTLRYDAAKVSAADVLRRVAYAGYDNERYLAPEEAWRRLPECCRYERSVVRSSAPSHPQHQERKPERERAPQQKENGVGKVYDAYFKLKDALVGSDASAAVTAAGQVLDALGAADMAAMDAQQHDVFMSLSEGIRKAAGDIAKQANLGRQRKAFESLSQATFALMKVFRPGYDVYLDHCPMYGEGGADWISREKPIRNPYYGSKMMTCGNVKETLTQP